jgi:hypothetical protein
VTSRRIIESRSGELAFLLSDLKKLHEELLAVIQHKLAAMRRADADAINSCLAREQFLVGRIRQQEGLRQQLVQLIGKELGLTPEQAVRLPLKALAERLDEPRRGQLLAQAAGLRETMLGIDRSSKVAAMVTGEMLKHFRQVCLAMARAVQSTGTYSPTGRLNSEAPAGVFEAVG